MPSKFRLSIAAALAVLATCAGVAHAQPGTSLGLVTLPGNGGCSVALAYDGTYVMTTIAEECVTSVIGIYRPPPGGTGLADLVATKEIVTAAGVPVFVSALEWDPTRNRLWGALGTTSGQMWLIDVGDKTAHGIAVATPAWTYKIDGFEIIDGLAWDRESDDLWISPDVDESVYRFDASTGAFVGAIQPKNEAGTPDASVSGVALSTGQTLYVARPLPNNGLIGEIRRVDKNDGTFVAGFTTTNFRVEDGVCADPRLYGVEAILVKDAYFEQYEAFQVEAGTCPLVTEQIVGTFTGGGSIPSPLFGRVTHGFELHCDRRELPNNLEINWGGNKFHLELLEDAKCVDTSGIEPEQPFASFDTYIGRGSGRCNGLPATATWTFTDAGEPGRLLDTAQINIVGGCTLAVTGRLEPGGNHQANDPNVNRKR